MTDVATAYDGGPYFYGQDREPSERLEPGRASARPYSSTLARLPNPQSPLTGVIPTARTVAEAASSRGRRLHPIGRPPTNRSLVVTRRDLTPRVALRTRLQSGTSLLAPTNG